MRIPLLMPIAARRNPEVGRQFARLLGAGVGAARRHVSEARTADQPYAVLKR